MHMVEVLSATFQGNDDERKGAEAALDEMRPLTGFCAVLLKVVEGAEGAVCVSASVQLKNFVARHWKNSAAKAGQLDDDDVVMDDGEKEMIRSEIVGVLVESDRKVQEVLQDAVYAIALVDYHEAWPALMPEVVSRLEAAMGEGNFETINALLRVVSRLFKKYEGQFASDPLLLELKYSLEQFQDPLLAMFSAASEAASGTDDQELQEKLFESMVLMSAIFYSLSVHDLPEHMEDNLGQWMQHYSNWLEYENEAAMAPTRSGGASPLVTFQAQIIAICALYTEIASEEFNEDYLPAFVQLIWKRLMGTTQDPSEDELFARAVRFLTSLASQKTHASIFEDESSLGAICEQVILPNIRFREIDMDTFMGDPQEYISQVLKGGDVDTRRHATARLIKGLCAQFRAPVTEIFAGYVGQLLESYASDPSEDGEGWIAKDAALFLVTQMTVVKASAKLGTTEVSEFADVPQFFQDNILPELLDGAVDAKPILKTDALLFTATFRNQLPPEALMEALPAIANQLVAEEFVPRTVAAHALSTILLKTVPGENDEPVKVFSPQTLDGDAIETLLVNLFGSMEKGDDRSQVESAFAMKAIMRVVASAGPSISPYVSTCIEKLTTRVGEACANPGDPTFNHYMFEAIASLIRVVCGADPSAVDAFEDMLFEPFTSVLQMEIEEFSPYVFQIMSSMVEIRSQAGREIPEAYVGLVSPLMDLDLWKVSSNVPAMVRLLEAITSAAPGAVVEANVVEPMLIIFQLLLRSRSKFPHAFGLLTTMMTQLPAEVIAPFRQEILILVMTKLQKTEKSPWYCRHFVLWMARYALHTSWDEVVGMFCALQDNLFGMLAPILADQVGRYNEPLERKIAVVSLIGLLTGSTMFVERFQDAWGTLFVGVLDALTVEMRKDDGPGLEQRILAVVDAAGTNAAGGSVVAGNGGEGMEYDTKFSGLSMAKKVVVDPVETVSDVGEFFVRNLVDFSGRVGGGVLSGLELSDDQGQNFTGLCQGVGVDPNVL